MACLFSGGWFRSHRSKVLSLVTARKRQWIAKRSGIEHFAGRTLGVLKAMRTLIIGGGVSGFALAEALEAQGRDYLLVEARGRFGGRIQTHPDAAI
ncbi:MAG TPA: hypothetical protein DHC76_09350 [Rhodobacteraceae bacterium]|nr:hypothetical protein [Paracoccaceae bacterium]